MAQIKVTPEQLRQAADQIETSANLIDQRVNEVSLEINRALMNDAFKGNLASGWLSHYQRVQPTMEEWPIYFKQFAGLLREAAARFVDADRTDGSEVNTAGAAAPTSTAPVADVGELQEQADALKADLDSKWHQLKDELTGLGLDVLGAVVATVGAAIATGGTSLAAQIAAALAGVGVSNMDTVGKISALANGIQADTLSYQDVGSRLHEQTMHVDFDTPEELDQLQANWENIRDTSLQSRVDIIGSWTGNDMNPLEKLINQVGGGIPQMIGMAATYDDYWNMFIDNELRLADAEAYLQAVNIRRQSL